MKNNYDKFIPAQKEKFVMGARTCERTDCEVSERCFKDKSNPQESLHCLISSRNGTTLGICPKTLQLEDLRQLCIHYQPDSNGSVGKCARNKDYSYNNERVCKWSVCPVECWGDVARKCIGMILRDDPRLQG